MGIVVSLAALKKQSCFWFRFYMEVEKFSMEKLRILKCSSVCNLQFIQPIQMQSMLSSMPNQLMLYLIEPFKIHMANIAEREKSNTKSPAVEVNGNILKIKMQIYCDECQVTFDWVDTVAHFPFHWRYRNKISIFHRSSYGIKELRKQFEFCRALEIFMHFWNSWAASLITFARVIRILQWKMAESGKNSFTKHFSRRRTNNFSEGKNCYRPEKSTMNTFYSVVLFASSQKLRYYIKGNVNDSEWRKKVEKNDDINDDEEKKRKKKINK